MKRLLQELWFSWSTWKRFVNCSVEKLNCGAFSKSINCVNVSTDSHPARQGIWRSFALVEKLCFGPIGRCLADREELCWIDVAWDSRCHVPVENSWPCVPMYILHCNINRTIFWDFTIGKLGIEAAIALSRQTIFHSLRELHWIDVCWTRFVEKAFWKPAQFSWAQRDKYNSPPPWDVKTLWNFFPAQFAKFRSQDCLPHPNDKHSTAGGMSPPVFAGLEMGAMFWKCHDCQIETVVQFYLPRHAIRLACWGHRQIFELGFDNGTSGSVPRTQDRSRKVKTSCRHPGALFSTCVLVNNGCAMLFMLLNSSNWQMETKTGGTFGIPWIGRTCDRNRSNGNGVSLVTFSKTARMNGCVCFFPSSWEIPREIQLSMQIGWT